MNNSAKNGAALPWISTDNAARELGMHPQTLRKIRDGDRGMVAGIHYRRGLHKSSPVKWNMRALQEFFTENAYWAPSQKGGS